MNNRRSDIAYNPPVVYDVRVPREYDDLVPLFTGFVIAELEATAAKNEARSIFLDMAQNNDRLMEMMVQTNAELFMFFVDRDNARDNMFETIIRETSKLVCNGVLVDTIKRNRHVFQGVLTAQQIDDMDQYARDLQDVFDEMEDFYNRGRRGGGRMDRRDSGRIGNRYRGDDRDSRYRGRDDYRERDDRSDRRDRDRDRGGRGIWVQDGRRPGTERDKPTGSVIRRSREQVFQKEEETRVEHPRRRTESGRRWNGVDVNARQMEVDGIVFKSMPNEPQWPMVADVEKPYNHFLLADGTQVQFAAISHWQLPFDADKPLFPNIDTQTHVLFAFKHPDGNVTFRGLARNEKMNYLDHELSPAMRMQAQEEIRRNEGKAGNAWNLTEIARPNPEAPLATAEPVYEDAEELQVIQAEGPDEFIVCQSLPQGINTQLLNYKIERPELFDTVFENYMDRMVLTAVGYPDFEVLRKLSTTTSFSDAHKLITAYRNQNNDRLNELLDEVNKRLTQGVNYAINHNLGCAWTIDDFTADIGELLVSFRKTYGEKVYECFRDQAGDILSKWLAHYGEDEQELVREQFGLADDLVVLVWKERSSVTHFPLSSAELRIPAPADTSMKNVVPGTMYRPSDNPSAFKAMEAIFRRTPAKPTNFHGRFITCNDGTVYELARGYYNPEAFMVFVAPFSLK